MFGRVRGPSSSPDSLERPPSKIIKDDPLSIYEATLMKLKLGSQRQPNSSPEVASEEIDGNHASVTTNIESNVHTIPSEISEVAMIEPDYSSENVSMVTSSGHSPATLKQHGTRNVSIRNLFSKFKNSQNTQLSQEQIIVENSIN